MTSSKRVVVAMSGGVDSSVAAALLVEQGYEVIGMMLRLWSEPGTEANNRCCTPDSIALARQVASKLGIAFYVLDVRQPFHDIVVNNFLTDYSRGITPNPCINCNRSIRFGLLLEHALAFGADQLATGHYAQVRRDADGKFQLLRAMDREKDQSYVLHILNQQQISRSMFPIGEYTKGHVRQLANQYDLPVASRRDSQDLCFLAGEDYRSFLLRNSPEALKPGKIVTKAGQILGNHPGLALFTIGQRKGLGVTSGRPMYVISKDIPNNYLVIGTLEDLGSSSLVSKNFNWINPDLPNEPFQAQVKIRYKSADAQGTIFPRSDNTVFIEFAQPMRDITPGQAAVVYQDRLCLGGGIIEQSDPPIHLTLNQEKQL